MLKVGIICSICVPKSQDKPHAHTNAKTFNTVCQLEMTDVNLFFTNKTVHRLKKGVESWTTVFDRNALLDIDNSI